MPARPAAPRPALTLAALLLAIAVFAAGAATAAARRRHRAATAAHRVRHRARAGAPGVPAHIPTWAFDDGCTGGAGARPGLVRRWLSYAESNCGPTDSKARRDCHAGGRTYCFSLQYLDTVWSYAHQPPLVAGVAAANWWLHAPAGGARIFTTGAGGGYLDNQLVPAVRGFFHRYVQRHYDADDGLMMDWQTPSLAQELFYSTCGCQRTQEISSDAALRAGHEAMSAALRHRSGRPFIQVDNTLPNNPFLPQGMDMLNRATGVDGWVVEGEPMSDGALDPYYSTLLDQIAYIATRTAGFIVPMSRVAAGAPDQAQTRRVQEGTMLLGFSPGHIVDWAQLETGSGDLAVWPEEGIYPTQPVQSMARPGGRGCMAGTGQECSRGGHNSLQVAPGVYRRAFRACYDRGAPIGPCAAIVNTTGHAVAVRGEWLRGAAVHHQLTFAGGDVQSGGALRLDGAPFAPGADVPAADALLLTR